MRRVAIVTTVLAAMLMLWTVAGSLAASPARVTQQACGTVRGPVWTVRVQESVGVRFYRGNRYQVRKGSFTCSRAKTFALRMIRTRTAQNLRAASFAGMTCRVKDVLPVPKRGLRILTVKPAAARGECDDHPGPPEADGKHFTWWPALASGQ